MKSETLTQKQLHKILHYNKDLGIFTWLISPAKHIKKGMVAGTIDTKGYHQIRYKRVSYKTHRLVWLYIYGEYPSNHIDHINHNRLDNRFCNLRNVNNQENGRNQSLYKDTKSGVTGVYCEPYNRFRARIKVDNKLINLGCYDTIEEAKNAREKANNKYRFHKNHGTAA